jgi:Ca2+-binding EF-hand superfamily protein
MKFFDSNADGMVSKDELKEMLNEVSRKSQLERKQMEAGFTRDTLTNVPMTIYIL